MPLAFPSLNQGAIAFGFFNIETDLLLLEHYFLFADDFCNCVTRMAGEFETGAFETSWEGYSIDRREEIGDLMAAIHGVRHTGFIGEVYRLFPFPQRQEDFKQKPEGHANRAAVESLIARYARRTPIPVRGDGENDTVAVAEYLFSKETFHRLIEYVWVGGYPRWRDGVRPDYVTAMKRRLESRPSWLMRSPALR